MISSQLPIYVYIKLKMPYTIIIQLFMILIEVFNCREWGIIINSALDHINVSTSPFVDSF